MTFCLVYEEVQTSLINKIECDEVTNQILRNAVVLVQGLWFIENRERGLAQKMTEYWAIAIMD
jgi:hypothetical protein